jgi:uncharacterized Ntn-hydrolase superfamily protein
MPDLPAPGILPPSGRKCREENAMTYSIVARDPQTKELGVAVQSRYFASGRVVPWAEPGVGAVATQAFTDTSYGPLGLALMRGGFPAQAALTALVAADDDPAIRQVAMIDASGGIAARTGGRCVAEAGQAGADGVSAQANMMERDTVWGAMLEAYQGADGSLGERLLAALQGAQSEGGDIRGRQSAGIVVVSGSRQDPPWSRTVDLRVDDHPDPVGEIGRLLRLQMAFHHMETATEAMARGDPIAAAAAMDQAKPLAPDDDQVAFTRGGILMATGRVEEGRREFDQAIRANPRWAVFLRRFAAAGFVPNDPAFLDAMLPLRSE